MHVAILHLSDIHIDSQHDRVLRKAEAIARTTNVISHAVDLWVILVSGDIAKKGSPAEYTLAERFLIAIRDHLRAFHPDSEVALVLVPGNHDCDFTLQTGVRPMLQNGTRVLLPYEEAMPSPQQAPAPKP